MSGLRIVRPGEGRAWWWQGGIVRMPATGEDTGQRFMLEETTVPPGGGPAPHIQNREGESFYIIEGGPIEFTAGNRKAALGAGGFVNIGKGTAHLFRNVGDSPARVLTWNFPAGFERFQLEAGEAPGDLEQPRRATGQDRQRAMRLAPDFGIDMHPDAAAFEREPVLRVVDPAKIEGMRSRGRRGSSSRPPGTPAAPSRCTGSPSRRGSLRRSRSRATSRCMRSRARSGSRPATRS